MKLYFELFIEVKKVLVNLQFVNFNAHKVLAIVKTSKYKIKIYIFQIDVTGMSKEDRTKIHDTVKKAFGESIVGSTVTENDKKFVVFDKHRKGGKFVREASN